MNRSLSLYRVCSYYWDCQSEQQRNIMHDTGGADLGSSFSNPQLKQHFSCSLKESRPFSCKRDTELLRLKMKAISIKIKGEMIKIVCSPNTFSGSFSVWKLKSSWTESCDFQVIICQDGGNIKPTIDQFVLPCQTNADRDANEPRRM